MTMQHLEMQKDEIGADYDKGLSITKLAIAYKCSWNTMKKVLIKWGKIKDD